MKKRTIILIVICAMLVIAAILAFKLRSAGTWEHVSDENCANFGTLLTDLVKAYEDPDTAPSLIEEDLEAIHKISVGDYEVAKSIADHWRMVYLDPAYSLELYHGEEVAAPSATAGIPNSRSHAIVVLGYELKDGQMQPELMTRCDAAAALARALPETVIVCSGGVTGENNTTGNTEAGLMKAYLTEHCGLDASRIFIDEAAMTTAENALNTLKILQSQKVQSMTIVTSAYHQCWGQADYNAVAAVYSMQHGYDVEIIGNYSCDVDPSVELYKTGWKIAAFQIAGILDLPEDVIKAMPSPFGKRPDQTDQPVGQAAEVTAAETPDYSDAANWACYEADIDKAADVFIICPTVDMKDEFNMSLDDEDTKASFLGALNMERGIYDADARMFAPYYRQGAMKIYSLDPDEAEQYLLLAYSDVSAAFSWYLDNENNGRPVILAGFSQGADMCYRLLQDYFGSKILSRRLVAVYAIGWPCTKEMVNEFPQIVPASSENDTGVVISFDCEAPEFDGSFIMPADIRAYSINPLNWRTDGTPADKSLNAGACFTDYSAAVKKEVTGLCGCYIDSRGALKVTDVDPADYPALIPGLPDGSYHIYDYQFFFRNLQQNVSTRLNAWMALSAAELANAA